MSEIYESVLEYRTEGEGACDHSVSIRDCLLGLQMAFTHLPNLKLDDFDVEDLLFMEQPQNGDLNWIVPGKLLALAGPTDLNWPIAKFIEYAQKNSIGCMVRLNRAHYATEEITKTGDIEHVEMFFHDGTNPTPQNVRDFINIVDGMNLKGRAVAVHCRAGLGRTGTMIAAHLLFQFARDREINRNHPRTCPCGHLSAKQVARAIIGFLRIMRPGSVLSGQPEFLESIAATVMKAGKSDNLDLIDSFDEAETEIDEFISKTSEEEIKSESFVRLFQIRSSKRFKMSTSSSASTESFKLKLKQQQHPVSHAGRGHAAEKHSTVHIEKL